MLLTVEGGGFFSSSASGYSKGLTLLFVKGKKEERPMRVSPWTQYQLVDRELNPELQLDSGRNQSSRGCGSFVCFGRAGLERVNGPSPPKVGTAHHSETLPDSSSSAAAHRNEEESAQRDAIHEVERKTIREGCLKKRATDSSNISPIDADDTLRATPNDTVGHAEKRKVQWTDACGKELYEIREFEPSDDDLSDDEFGHGDQHRRCQCVIQ